MYRLVTMHSIAGSLLAGTLGLILDKTFTLRLY